MPEGGPIGREEHKILCRNADLTPADEATLKMACVNATPWTSIDNHLKTNGTDVPDGWAIQSNGVQIRFVRSDGSMSGGGLFGHRDGIIINDIHDLINMNLSGRQSHSSSGLGRTPT